MTMMISCAQKNSKHYHVFNLVMHTLYFNQSVYRIKEIVFRIKVRLGYMYFKGHICNESFRR